MVIKNSFTLRPTEQEVAFLMPQFVVNGYKTQMIKGEEVIVFYL